jgi:putative ATPase
MRPRGLDDIIGQDHIVGQGRLLRRAIQADRISSLIFYGPPGTGKTSLARVIANTTKSTFESLNAVLAGIKDAREAVDRATERRNLYGTRTILFVDEVHRWNKAQQDALLPWVENGVIILIGATTENPFFEVNRALVSRSRIFQLRSLDKEELFETARRALADKERGYGAWRVTFEQGALDHLAEVAGGDARSLLNALELAVETTPSVWPPPESAEIYVSLEAAEQSIQRRVVLYDRDGDCHFDTISAFIKSVRGSDPDAALYWLAKMVKAGEDPSFIFRRMIILASEDVGLADPHALSVVVSCAKAFDRIGFPEGNFPLAHACLYLATAPKSNSTLAFFDAMKEVEKEHAETPNHLRDANRDSESFGHGEGYIYPHAYRDHWAAQQYLPTTLRGKTFYTPSTIGYEGAIREDVLRKREIQAAVLLDDDKRGDALTWTAASKGREGWFKRLSGGRSALLLRDRDIILEQCPIRRHSRILIVNADDGLLLWEALRRAPEGLSAACVRDEAAKSALLGCASTFDETERPLIWAGGLPSQDEAEAAFSCKQFDCILSREPWRRTGGGGAAFTEFAQKCRNLLAPAGVVVVLQSPPALGGKISRILEASLKAERILLEAPEQVEMLNMVEKLAEAERAFFTAEGNKPELLWNAQTLETAFVEAGFSAAITQIDQKEDRLLTERDMAAWFNTEKSSWGAFIARELGDEAFFSIQKALSEQVNRGPVEWKWKSLLLRARFGTGS